jgi:hypothetical protein
MSTLKCETIPCTLSTPTNIIVTTTNSNNMVGTGTRKPTYINQQINFQQNIKLSYITFNNFYCAFITIKQMVQKENSGKENKSTYICKHVHFVIYVASSCLFGFVSI